jgi:hypothetical protein
MVWLNRAMGGTILGTTLLSVLFSGCKADRDTGASQSAPQGAVASNPPGESNGHWTGRTALHWGFRPAGAPRRLPPGVPRIAHLREANPAMAFLSAELLLEDLGDVDFTEIIWVIVGGKSGAGAVNGQDVGLEHPTTHLETVKAIKRLQKARRSVSANVVNS